MTNNVPAYIVVECRPSTEEDGYVSAEVNGERILDDTATDVWCELKQQEEFRKEIVCLHEHPDCDFYSITKKGFEMIILGW